MIDLQTIEAVERIAELVEHGRLDDASREFFSSDYQGALVQAMNSQQPRHRSNPAYSQLAGLLHSLYQLKTNYGPADPEKIRSYCRDVRTLYGHNEKLSPAADRPEAEAAPAAKPGKKQPIRRRKGATPKPRPLTPRQVEVIQVVGDCKGNLAESARRLRRDRKTIKEIYQAGMKKLGKNVIHQKKNDRLIARDRRGAFDVSDIDDERREADETERRKYRRRQ